MPRGGMIAIALGLERGSAVPAGDGGRLLDPGRQLLDPLRDVLRSGRAVRGTIRRHDLSVTCRRRQKKYESPQSTVRFEGSEPYDTRR